MGIENEYVIKENRDLSLRSGERQVAEDLAHIEPWHRWRYREAVPYCQGKNVLDIGCGCGYGPWILADHGAKSVFGVDISPEAIRYAEDHWSLSGITFHASEFKDLNLAPGFADVLVAFEIIEHLPDTQETFDKFQDLNPKTIILSVPHIYTPFGGNRFHYRHYGMDEIIGEIFRIRYKPVRAELKYFGNNLNVFVVAEKKGKA
jgi:2-polyprenyl-3-methyl-5-hydroxy-6-metoxy-1,4-benzoquinol methylase